MMINKKGTKFLSLLLLVAVMLSAIPLHQLLHQHQNLKEQTHTCEVNKYEPHCCKPANVFHKSSAILQQDLFLFLSQQETVYHRIYQSIVVLKSLSFSNKAPPVYLS
ncbi:hypothetical protein [Pedobacter puniceum]|uniref:Uncharacterized protein n=1 Tax=Pedobacter puniceum TaxID=2666136 RepID=A0A7K0FRY2_9SPHI|nr:hypothetical protein [Pedobacter puniceum]MRX48523.1 hypothetical protein [Pedobacter puniceum]